MKTIGVIGGMSWESTVTYYQGLNQGIKERLGGHNSAKVLINSVNFAEIEQMQRDGAWDSAAVVLCKAAQSLEKAGADFILIATNTMHKLADQIEESISIPLLHIADATGHELTRRGIHKVGLLGTAFTMEEEFYKQRITNKFGIEVIVPNGVQRKLVHDVIYDELCQGKLNRRLKHDYQTIIEELAMNGAQGVILGCTEIGLLVNQTDTEIALFDTAEIHVQEAIKEALNES
ncbi:aspartate/glutamate racemase family protein [Vibrio sp. 16]|uniref:aspartate/glutamate racemase family protein n=1 Tax=Vibrio sp. 16 TaxID=391586 RepID=UPI002FEF9070